VDKEELRERYEAYCDEHFYDQAKQLYEQALERSPGDARLLREYGYLQECHGRYAIRAAAECYQHAIDADPQQDKSHLQLISALAALWDLDTVIPRYEQQVADAPGGPRGYRLLSAAYLGVGDYEKAIRTIRTGLEITLDDPALTELQGDVYAATGSPDDALASWHHAFTLAPEDYGISMRYSAAFLLERQGRLAEAAGEWRFIIDWLEEHGETIHIDWPRRELYRLESEQAGG
jgi:tetratricopeptide (TPR) repeat protein